MFGFLSNSHHSYFYAMNTVDLDPLRLLQTLYHSGNQFNSSTCNVISVIHTVVFICSKTPGNHVWCVDCTTVPVHVWCMYRYVCHVCMMYVCTVCMYCISTAVLLYSLTVLFVIPPPRPLSESMLPISE